MIISVKTNNKYLPLRYNGKEIFRFDTETGTLLIDGDYLVSFDNAICPNRTFIDAIAINGAKAQTDVAIEEMAELTQALIHNRRGRPANIAEEIADVEIMLEQLKIIHCCADEVEKQKDAKIKRMAFKLKQKEEGK